MSLEELYKEEKKKSPYIKLGDGESFEGEFVGVEKTIGFGGKETFQFTFIVDGIEKTMNAGFSLLRSMGEQNIKEGDNVIIKRDGEGIKTKYTAKKVS